MRKATVLFLLALVSQGAVANQGVVVAETAMNLDLKQNASEPARAKTVQSKELQVRKKLHLTLQERIAAMMAKKMKERQ